MSAKHTHTVKLQECLLSPLQALVNVSFNAKGSLEVKSEVKSLCVDDSYELVTLDVVDMFTNMPTQWVYGIIDDKHSVIQRYTSIPLHLFMALLKFALKFSNVFKHRGQVYIQGKGLPMGGKLSTVISCLIMDRMFQNIFNGLLLDDILWFKKFVDDCVFLIKKAIVNEFLQKCNSVHDDLKFTIGRSEGGSIQYLDLNLIVVGRIILTKWHLKPISSGRILNYLSNHHPKIIRNVALQFLIRILSLSDKSFHGSVIKQGTDLLKLNAYPRWYIDKVLAIAVKAYKA